MRPRMRFASLAVLTLVLGAAAALDAQTGTMTGLVNDNETGEPLANASVEVLGSAGAQAGGILTDQVGRFSFVLPPGAYSIVISSLGYEAVRVDGVRIGSGETEFVTVAVNSRAFLLNPIVVTASRREEKAIESPASVVVVGAEAISERPATTLIEHVRALPGVDVAQTGIQQSNVVTRGFNNVFSGALLVLTDNRYAFVPSLRLNAYNFIPTTDLDLERIEVLLGPAAALYGPNSASGVMHMITTSPIDVPGTRVSLAGGERSIFQTVFRHATRVSDRVGFKVSGQYFRGEDWEFEDPAEVMARSDALVAGADVDTLLIGKRNFDAERISGDVRLDFRPDDDTELIFSGGANSSLSSIELTGIGAGQTDQWVYSYGQTRFRKGRFFAQAFGNVSSAGDTYLLRTGQPIVDKSRMWAGQVQHGIGVGESQDFIGGLDIQQTQPRTDSTITGRNEQDDNIFEIGGYLHSETNLSDKVDVVAAVRLDHHSELEDLVFSPRAALVYHPEENQNFRLTFNRAFSTPTTNNLFLDLVAARASASFPYDIRAMGVPKTGFTFDNECAGGVQNLCMFSPFTPGQQLPANAAVAWDGLIANVIVPALGQVDPLLTQLPWDLLLPNPGAAVGSVLRRFNFAEAQKLQPDPNLLFLGDEGPIEIVRIKPTITNTIEVGYKGLLGDRVLLSGDVYFSSSKDFVGSLRVETPTVFLNPDETLAYVQGQLTAAAQAGLLPPQLLPLIPTLIEQIVGGLARIPVGNVSPDQVDASDFIVTYRNFGDIDLWGADFAAQALLTDEFSLRGSLSLVSEECFDQNNDGRCDGPLDIALNAPKTKGSFSARYENQVTGFSAEARVRAKDAFPMNSGVYVGDVESYAVFDLNFGYKVTALSGATLSLSATNIFDDKHADFIGAPEIGRMVLLRVLYEF